MAVQMPKLPTNLQAISDGVSKTTLTWENHATTSAPYESLIIKRTIQSTHDDHANWVEVATLDGNAEQWTDTDVVANKRYWYTVTARNSAGTAQSGEYNLSTKPSAPINVQAQYDGVSMCVNWENTAPFASCRIGYSVDGGAWFNVPGYEYGNRFDQCVTADHAYRYRVRAYADSFTSDYVESETVYTTPVPVSNARVERTSATGVLVTLTNPTRHAKALEVQRKTESGWVSIATIPGRVKDFTDEPGTGMVTYRMRNTRDDLVSDWFVTDTVGDMCPPDAPRIVTPASSIVVPTSTRNVGVEWRYFSRDNATQTAAEIRVMNNTAEHTYTVNGNTQAFNLTNDFPVNSSVSIQVRTKGAHSAWGEWSDQRTFYVCKAPTVTIEQPADNTVIISTPIHVKMTYEDVSGSLAAGHMSIAPKGGYIEYERDIKPGDALEWDVTLDDFLPKSGNTYTLTVNVRSSSTLATEVTHEFSVKFEPPVPAVVNTRMDNATGYVAIEISEGVNDNNAPMEYCNLYRVVDGERVLLGSRLVSGAVVVDKYAPLNREFEYVTASFANIGAVNEQSYTESFVSDYLYIYYPGGIACGKYNAEESIDVNPDCAFYSLAGKTYPVAVIGENIEEKRNINVQVQTRDEAMAFYRMAKSCEACIVKTLSGMVFHAVVQPSFTPRLNSNHTWNIGCEVTRIAGDVL